MPPQCDCVSLNTCRCSSIQRINFHSLHIYLFVTSKLQMWKEASYLFLGMPRGNWKSKLQSFIYSDGMTTVQLYTASKLTAGMCSIISLLDLLAFHLKSIFLSVQVFTYVDAEYSRCYAGCQGSPYSWKLDTRPNGLFPLNLPLMILSKLCTFVTDPTLSLIHHLLVPNIDITNQIQYLLNPIIIWCQNECLFLQSTVTEFKKEEILGHNMPLSLKSFKTLNIVFVSGNTK